MILGFIKPRLLTDAEQTELAEAAQSINPILHALSHRLYKEDNLRQLRRDIVAKQVTLKPKEKAALDRLNKITMPLLEGHVCCVAKLARTFYRAHADKASYSDFFQEASLALLDAIFFYDGTTKFITYGTSVMRNRLLDYMRTLSFMTPPAQYILDQRDAVKQLTNAGMLFDDAVKQLKFDEKTIENVKRAMVDVKPYSQIRKNENSSIEELGSASNDESHSFELHDAREAVTAANLSPIEAAVFDAYLRSSNNDGFRSEVAREFNLTRAAAAGAFKRAVAKIQEAYHTLSRHQLKEAA